MAPALTVHLSSKISIQLSIKSSSVPLLPVMKTAFYTTSYANAINDLLPLPNICLNTLANAAERATVSNSPAPDSSPSFYNLIADAESPVKSEVMVLDSVMSSYGNLLGLSKYYYAKLIQNLSTFGQSIYPSIVSPLSAVIPEISTLVYPLWQYPLIPFPRSRLTPPPLASHLALAHLAPYFNL